MTDVPIRDQETASSSVNDPIAIIVCDMRHFAMPESLDAMKAALRVLRDITNGIEPRASDVYALRAFAPASSLPPDELACDVIQRAIKQRATERAMGSAA